MPKPRLIYFPVIVRFPVIHSTPFRHRLIVPSNTHGAPQNPTIPHVVPTSVQLDTAAPPHTASDYMPPGSSGNIVENALTAIFQDCPIRVSQSYLTRAVLTTRAGMYVTKRQRNISDIDSIALLYSLIAIAIRIAIRHKFYRRVYMQ